MFYHAHLDIFYLCDALLEIQEISFLKMRNSSKISTNPSAVIIESYMATLQQNEMTRLDFVHDLAGKYLPIKIKKLIVRRLPQTNT